MSSPRRGDPRRGGPRAPAAGVRGTDEHGATEQGSARVAADRRAVALSGHRGDVTLARGALAHPAGSVRATALGALRRLGNLEGADLESALDDPDPQVRRRVVELSVTYRGVDIISSLSDLDPSVVEMAAYALGERIDAAAVPALDRLASPGEGHADPLCREAAVAALGSIGDPAGLNAVLRALDDKPAVRRRAAVALAAFDGPEVESALVRCLGDRDWQVRQVAEDLLAEDLLVEDLLVEDDPVENQPVEE